MNPNKLPQPPWQYDPEYERQRNKVIEDLRKTAFTGEGDLVLKPKTGVVLFSPNGAPWRLTVDDTGTVTVTAL